MASPVSLLVHATATPDDGGACFRDWVDFDRQIAATLANQTVVESFASKDLGTVLLHSRKSPGGDKAPYRVTDPLPFWARQGSAPSTSTMLIEVPGARSGKDVGLDFALVVHLFETAPSWGAAVLFRLTRTSTGRRRWRTSARSSCRSWRANRQTRNIKEARQLLDAQPAPKKSRITDRTEEALAQKVRRASASRVCRRRSRSKA